MGLLLRATVVAVHSTFFVSAFITSPPASRCQSQLVVDSLSCPIAARVSRCSSRSRSTRDVPSCYSDHLATTFDPRISSRRPGGGGGGITALLSSRTVDVDVIDVTDVTEEETARQKEQVQLIAL